MRNSNDAQRRRRPKKDALVLVREVEIINRMGMHLRPATKFVNIAKSYRCTVTVRRGTKTVNGKSIMDMIFLEALPGTKLQIEGEGDDAEACLAALAQLVKDKFHED